MSHFIWVMNVKGCCFFDPMNWNIAVLDYFPLQIKCWYQSSVYITSASPLNSFMKRWRSHSILDMILYGTETLGFDMCCICVSILSLIDGYFWTQLLGPQIYQSIKWMFRYEYWSDIYSKLQYNVCKYHWYPTEKTIRWSSFISGNKNLETEDHHPQWIGWYIGSISGISSWDREFWNSWFQDFETFGVSW